MKPIQTNKPVFFGNDGDVLKSGQIYIGQPNQYPISFPKTVTLQDSSGAQFEAQQPLRTNDQGQVSYNGKAIIALVDGNYSMLIQDRNGAAVQDGYTPFVSNPGEAEANLGSVTQVGLLLPDIKLLDVTPGDTVRNVGKITATDGLGADWLVVSNTGNPADDETLIDFANGLQGQRIDSIAYRSVISQDIGSGRFRPENATLVWEGLDDTGVNMSELSEGGPGFYVVEQVDDTHLIYIVDESLACYGNGRLLGNSVSFGLRLSFVDFNDSVSGSFYLSEVRFDPNNSVYTTNSLQITRIWKV